MKVIDSKLPWFKLYAGDFLTRTVGLTNEETGVYIKLLAYFWAYGPQPNNVDVIKSIVGGGNVELVLARYFETDQNGKLYEPSLQELREESLEIAKTNSKRTAAATAKRMEQAATERHVDVTSSLRQSDDLVTLTEIEVEVKKKKEVQAQSEAPRVVVPLPSKPESPLSITDPLHPLFGMTPGEIQQRKARERELARM